MQWPEVEVVRLKNILFRRLNCTLSFTLNTRSLILDMKYRNRLELSTIRSDSMDNMVALLGRVEMGKRTGKCFLANFAEKDYAMAVGLTCHFPGFNSRQEYINSMHTTPTDTLATNRAFEHEVTTWHCPYPTHLRDKRRLVRFFFFAPFCFSAILEIAFWFDFATYYWHQSTCFGHLPD